MPTIRKVRKDESSTPVLFWAVIVLALGAAGGYSYYDSRSLLTTSAGTISASDFSATPLTADQQKAQDEINAIVTADATKKDKLINDIRTHVVSDKEMKQAIMQGPDVFVRYNQNFEQADIERRFDELLAQQYRLRAIKQKYALPPIIEKACHVKLCI